MPGPTEAWYSPRGKSAPGLIISRLATKWRPLRRCNSGLPANMLICLIVGGSREDRAVDSFGDEITGVACSGSIKR